MDQMEQAAPTFAIAVAGGKGRFARGKKAGLFFPHVDNHVQLPQPGETWHLVEGVKDAALHELSVLACGLNTCRLAAKFARLFNDVDIVLVPDRDSAGSKGALVSASVLHEVARSIRIATLPMEFRKTKGADVRDVLKLDGGRDLVMTAIADAKPWLPTSTALAGDDRVEIIVTPDEHRVNDQAVDALKSDQQLFQPRRRTGTNSARPRRLMN
ncbi:MAG: toprim domain-containing protein [Pirellulales bacterium]